MTTKNENKYLRKPDWIRSNLILSEKAGAILKMLKKKGLHTVCQEASCPNKGTCWNNNDITFLVMGPHCTRNCKFCNVESTFPDKLNLNEPSLISDVINQLKSDYSVITSVTRDDLEDYGCSHFVNIIKTIKKNCNTAIELLIPDFKTKKEFLSNIINENPDVIGHNIETVETDEFDPEFHNAVMQVPSEEHDNGQIVQVMQKGYTLKETPLYDRKECSGEKIREKIINDGPWKNALPKPTYKIIESIGGVSRLKELAKK